MVVGGASMGLLCRDLVAFSPSPCQPDSHLPPRTRDLALEVGDRLGRAPVALRLALVRLSVGEARLDVLQLGGEVVALDAVGVLC